jgi:outer membrane protein assembly factor BamB
MSGERAWFRRRNHEIEQLSPSLVRSIFITPEDSRYPAATYTADLIDGVLYASDENGSLLAIDATTGKELWRQPISGPARFVQVIADVVYAADTHALHAIRR